MIKFENVCLDCHERAVGCHGTCERYKEAKENHKKKVDDFLIHKRAENDIDDFKTKSIMATKNMG